MTDTKLIPEVNIGTLGHVDHGKSTLVEALASKWTSLHSEELKRGITIKLGYADATIYRCEKGELTTKEKCLTHNCTCKPERTVSFVDAPGHETLMATVLSGASLMDGVLFVIAANEKCPQPQTAEHLNVLNIVGMKNIIIVQSKIDLVTEEQAKKSYQEIKNFVKGTVAENAPIIPVSSQQKINIDALLEAIQEKIPTPTRKSDATPKMLVVRSFDINKPGTKPAKIVGGIIGGSLIQGKLKIGDIIEIRPGTQVKGKWQPMKSKIIGLQKAMKDLEEADPGGLLGVMTELDPAITKADSITGNVAGFPDKLPPVLSKINLELHLFASEQLKPAELVMVAVGTARTVGTVANVKKGVAEIELKIPVAAESKERAAIARKTGDRWKLVGWGLLK